MKIALIAITANGKRLSEAISAALGNRHDCRRMILAKYADSADHPFTDLKALTADCFPQYDALIFLCACGIAVRMIAPHIASKTTDPAVVVLDEQGRFAVSLLSGHLGGANALTEQVAAGVGAVPIITTATDSGGKFSPDCFAAANGLHICEMDIAKDIAAAIVNGKTVGFACDFPYAHLPDAYFDKERTSLGICITEQLNCSPFDRTLHLIPKNIVIGVGCKRHTPPEELEAFVLAMLRAHHLPIWRVCELHTIDLKQDEPAITAFCRKHRIGMKVYTAQELMAVAGDFTSSAFVLHTTGADNICERSAAANGAVLCVRKQSGSGVTFAAGKRPISIDFERRSV